MGDVFQVQNNSGEVTAVKVMEIDQENETFKLDGNHPLADKSLTFEVKIVSARMGTEEELEKVILSWVIVAKSRGVANGIPYRHCWLLRSRENNPAQASCEELY